MTTDATSPEIATAATSPAVAPFDAKTRARLRQIARFLSNIGDANIGARAAMHGYDTEEHSYGWKQYAMAQGMDRPFEHYLAEAEAEHLLEADSATVERYRFLDEIENKWLPRCQNVLRRFVAEPEREVFAKAFFDGLEQQPMGPGVVGSVGTFLRRFEALAESDTPGARAAYDAMEKRGFDQVLRGRIQATLEQAQAQDLREHKVRVSREELAAAWQKQHQAYEKLNLWYIDWADTLRSELSYHEQLRLGLIKPRRSKGALVDEVEAGDDEVDDEVVGERD